MARYIQWLEAWSKETGLDEIIEEFAKIACVMGGFVLGLLVFPLLIAVKIYRRWQDDRAERGNR